MLRSILTAALMLGWGTAAKAVVMPTILSDGVTVTETATAFTDGLANDANWFVFTASDAASVTLTFTEPSAGLDLSAWLFAGNVTGVDFGSTFDSIRLSDFETAALGDMFVGLELIARSDDATPAVSDLPAFSFTPSGFGIFSVAVGTETDLGGTFTITADGVRPFDATGGGGGVAIPLPGAGLLLLSALAAVGGITQRGRCRSA
ncbi:MAG: hypothetical protein ACFBSD_07475 [Paracoccaceae bacterium]